MITAITDALLATSLAGFPVYAGGDDVAVLAPGYVERDKLQAILEHYKLRAEPHRSMLSNLPNLRAPKLSGFSGGEIAYVTRLNYWGLLQPDNMRGFHRTPIGAVYPAPAAYGRSYGVLVAHYRDPFQALWNAAGQLEELKDSIDFRAADCGYELHKDATFLAHGRASGLAGTPFPVVPLPNREPAKPEGGTLGVAGPIRRALDLAAAVVGDYPGVAVSRSIYSDFQAECSMAETLTSRAGDHCNAPTYRLAVKLAAMLARRNAEDRGSES